MRKLLSVVGTSQICLRQLSELVFLGSFCHLISPDTWLQGPSPGARARMVHGLCHSHWGVGSRSSSIQLTWILPIHSCCNGCSDLSYDTRWKCWSISFFRWYCDQWDAVEGKDLTDKLLSLPFHSTLNNCSHTSWFYTPFQKHPLGARCSCDIWRAQ